MVEVGYVYILENKAMPDMWKIGITGRKDLKVRLKELFSTGVPLPFECVYAVKVKDYKKVEKAIQNAFKKERVHKNREFFTVEPDRVIPLLELYKIEDATISVNKELNKSITEEDKKAKKRYKGRRPSFKFEQMGIKIGSKITFAKEDISAEAIVTTDNKVIHNNIKYDLYPLTQKLLGKSYSLLPLRYWKYKGKLCQDYYNETYLITE